ncbi:MAG TPA: O-acetyl-ADP-ribose deacetylase [Usitatibacter sp.]|jgi:O-acetyl-ADP-ribose deacetylase (regulator of RNase III)|nr:O-acetyl-ADP-ribose deacetylase [Usitatibacter sp.]
MLPVIIKVGDITQEDVDAIVNAANPTLLGGGGVDGAIHRAGGPAILAACRKIRETKYPEGLPVGEAVITGGGNLRARYVIHTVGPIYGSNGGKDAALLGACYENSIMLASEHQLSTIAFPAISTGAYGYPKSEAARVARAAILRAMNRPLLSVRQVTLVFSSEADAAIMRT